MYIKYKYSDQIREKHLVDSNKSHSNGGKKFSKNYQQNCVNKNTHYTT